MKAQFLKIAGVKSEAAFYKKFPSEEAFFKAHPKARNLVKKALGGTSTPPTANQFFDYGMQARGPLLAPDISYQTGGQYSDSINETDFKEPNYYNDLASNYEQDVISMYPSYEEYKYGGAKKKYKTGGSNGIQGGNINAAGSDVKENLLSFIRGGVAKSMMNKPMARYGGQRRLRRAQEGMAMQEQAPMQELAPQQGGDPMAQIVEQIGQALQQGAKPEEVVVQLLQNQMPPEEVAKIFVQLGMQQEQVQQLITTVMKQVQGAQQGASQDQMVASQDQMMAEDQMDPNQTEQMPMAAYGMELPQRQGNPFTDMYQNELDSNAQGSKYAWESLANVFEKDVDSRVQKGAAGMKAKDQAAFWDQFKKKSKNNQTAQPPVDNSITSDVDYGQGQSIDLAPQNPNPWQMKKGGALKKFLPKHQTVGSTGDPKSWIKQILDFESKQGSASGTGLSNYGIKKDLWAAKYPKMWEDDVITEDEAMDFIEKEYLPLVKDYPEEAQKRLVDYSYNTGRDIRDVVMLASGVQTLDNVQNKKTDEVLWNANKDKIMNSMNDPQFINKLDEAKSTIMQDYWEKQGTPEVYNATSAPRIGMWNQSANSSNPTSVSAPGQIADPNNDPNGDSKFPNPNSTTNATYTNEEYFNAYQQYPDAYTGPGSDVYEGGVSYDGSAKTGDANKTTTTTNDTELEKHIKYFADVNGLDYDLLLKNYKDRMYKTSNNQGQGYYGDLQQVPYKYKHRGYGTIGSDRGYIPTEIDLERMSERAEELGFDVKKAKIRNNMFGTKVVFKTKYNPNTGKIEKVAEKVNVENSNPQTPRFATGHPQNALDRNKTSFMSNDNFDSYDGSEINPTNNSVVPTTNTPDSIPINPLARWKVNLPTKLPINASANTPEITSNAEMLGSNDPGFNFNNQDNKRQGGALNRFLPKHQVDGNTGNWFDNLMHPNKNNKSERSVWKTKKEPNPFAADYMIDGVLPIATNVLERMTNDPRLLAQNADSRVSHNQFGQAEIKDMGDYRINFGDLRPNETFTFDSGYKPGNAAGDYGNYSKQGGPISPYPYPSQIPFMQGNGNSRNMSMYSGWSQRPVMAYGGGYQQNQPDQDGTMYLTGGEIEQILAMGGQIEYLD